MVIKMETLIPVTKNQVDRWAKSAANASLRSAPLSLSKGRYCLVARKRNRKRTPTPSRSTFVAPVASVTVEPPKGRIRRAGERLLDSAIDTALEAFWLGTAVTLGGLAMTAAVAFVLYLRSPESSWIYPFMKYALVYAGGMLTILLSLAGFALLGVRRRKLREKQNSARFKSADKGYLDHWLHFGESNKRFQSVLAEIGAEMGRIGTCAGSMAEKLPSARNDPKRAHRIVTKGAAALNRHSAKMEQSIEALRQITDLLLESTLGLAHSANTASQGNAEELQGSREGCIGLLAVADTAIASVQEFRGTAIATLGISQDTNSAMNRIIYGLESIIDLLSQAERRWKETLVILDRKLAS